MESIGTVFDKCNQLYLTCTDSSPDESFILSSIATIEESLDRVIKADLFSVGEELEEYSTQTLKVSPLNTINWCNKRNSCTPLS